MHLSKHHGLGNDFLVLLDLDDRHVVGADDVVAVCHRTRGLGADGFIRATRGTDTDLVMVLRNADGSRAEMSGNGICCLGQAAIHAAAVAGPTLTVDSDAGIKTLELLGQPASDRHRIRVDLGPIPDPVEAPEWQVDGVRRAAWVDVGNPHLVLLADQLHDIDLAAVGEQANAEVAGGVNVEVVTVEAEAVEMRVYERGVGITDACGTGACATAAATRTWELTGGCVEVDQAGGRATVELGATTRYAVDVVAVARVDWPWA